MKIWTRFLPSTLFAVFVALAGADHSANFAGFALSDKTGDPLLAARQSLALTIVARQPR